MAINLSNVNISSNEFQRISSGTHNAGEVKLAGTDKLAKMNHHVGTFLSNNETIFHAEVIAINQALVKTLSQNGVMQDEINRIRQDLGLATRNAADKNLLYRSIVPLTRQQVRAILDRNAIAGFKTGSVKSVTERLGGSEYRRFHRGGSDHVNV